MCALQMTEPLAYNDSHVQGRSACLWHDTISGVTNVRLEFTLHWKQVAVPA